jgi:two-component system, response regulator PdtaR
METQSPHLRVALADDDAKDRIAVKNMLESLGHDVVAEACNGEQLIETVAKNKPDLIVTDLHMPGLDGLEAADVIAEREPTPVVVISASHAPQNVEQALRRKNVLGYLVKPFASGMLDGAIRQAYGLFRRFRGLEDKLSSLQQTLEDRKTIEKAKGVLMKYFGVDEPEAHRRLQKMASSKNHKLIDLARSILKTGIEGS